MLNIQLGLICKDNNFTQFYTSTVCFRVSVIFSCVMYYRVMYQGIVWGDEINIHSISLRMLWFRDQYDNVCHVSEIENTVPLCHKYNAEATEIKKTGFVYLQKY